MPLSLSSLDAIIFDFDGVLTDDRVYLDENGRESVCCSRRDGLGFDILRRTGLRLFILSTEKNPVVSRRGEKLQVPVMQGVADKLAALKELGCDLTRTLFVGNDVNDLPAMRACGFSACPADAHPAVLAEATFVLATLGGMGVVREIVEGLLGIEPISGWHGSPPEAASHSTVPPLSAFRDVPGAGRKVK